MGWQHSPDADEDGGTGYERDGVRVELTYFVSGESGEVFIALRDQNALWSEHSLANEVLELHGARTRVIPVGLLRRGKSRPRDDPNEAENRPSRLPRALAPRHIDPASLERHFRTLAHGVLLALIAFFERGSTVPPPRRIQC